MISLWAGEVGANASGPRRAGWYPKTTFTFSDAIGLVRYQL